MPRAPLFPHIPKKREPLFPHVSRGQAGEKLLEILPQAGTCYQDAWRFIIKEQEGQLLHGSVQTIGKRINHAWVETETGYVWEPESGDFMNKDYFYRRAQPRIEARYTPEEASIMAARTKNFGPWTEQERRQYLRGKPSRFPQVTIEGGEPVPTGYRHLVSWIDEPLPDYSLMTLPAVEVTERKIDAVMKQLRDGVETIQQSENFRLFLTTMSKFHDYSIGNQILIMIQRKDATHVAGYNTWKDLGRWVKAGEKGISILAPVLPPRPTCPQCGAKIPKGAKYCPVCGIEVEPEPEGLEPRYFKVVYVFDIAQTEGKPLPEFEVPVLSGDVNEQLFTKVMALDKGQGLTISFESRPDEAPAIKGQYLPPNRIWVRPEEPRAQQLKTLLHESAHYYSEGVFRIPRHDAETIAESAAYVIGAHYGFDTGVRSFPYVALWARDKKVLEQNLEAIRKVSTTILEALEKLK